jgi:pyrophosphatase PpaX
MKREFDIALFDGDGTKWDSMAHIHESMAHALLSVVKRNVLIHEIIGGASLEQTFLHCLGGVCDPETLDALIRSYEAHERMNQDRNTILPYPGVIETVAELKAAGIKMGIVTTRGRNSLQKILRQNNLNTDPDNLDYLHLITGDDAINHKPHPEPVSLALQRFGVTNPERVVMVGDTEKDIFGAKSARVFMKGLGQGGVRTIGVTYGHMDPVEMKKTGADFYADNFPQVGSIILGR